MPRTPAYERLAFCLIGVAWPNELIKDRRTTPYNVGQTVELRDFDQRDDLHPLAEALGGNPESNQKLIDRILHWTGGHPYLTLRLSAQLKQVGARLPTDVDQWIDELFSIWIKSVPMYIFSKYCGSLRPGYRMVPVPWTCIGECKRR